MTQHADNAIDSTESGMKQIRGPRAKFFYCIAWKNKEHGHLYEMVQAESSEEAGVKFEAKYGCAPNVIDGGEAFADQRGGSGYYLAKGTGQSSESRTSVTVSAEHMRSTTTHIKGEFRGWIVYGNGIKGFTAEGHTYKDDDLVSLMFHELADKNNKVPRPKLKKQEAIPMSEIKIISKSA